MQNIHTISSFIDLHRRTLLRPYSWIT